MHSTNYIIRFVLVMTTLVAVVLALMSIGLKPIHNKNEAVYNKRAILSAIATDLGKNPASLTDSEVQEIFTNQIEQKVYDMSGNELSQAEVETRGYRGGLAENVDMAQERKKPEANRILPLYIFTNSEGEKRFILSVRGSGLWDEIWGNIALKEDANTISGVSFDHKGETAGLGAEIKDNPSFPAKFVDKTIYDESGEYQSVDVVKGTLTNPAHQVDGISGATITGVGVGEMLYRGIKYYEPILNKVK